MYHYFQLIIPTHPKPYWGYSRIELWHYAHVKDMIRNVFSNCPGDLIIHDIAFTEMLNADITFDITLDFMLNQFSSNGLTESGKIISLEEHTRYHIHIKDTKLLPEMFIEYDNDEQDYMCRFEEEITYEDLVNDMMMEDIEEDGQEDKNPKEDKKNINISPNDERIGTYLSIEYIDSIDEYGKNYRYENPKKDAFLASYQDKVEDKIYDANRKIEMLKQTIKEYNTIPSHLSHLIKPYHYHYIYCKLVTQYCRKFCYTHLPYNYGIHLRCNKITYQYKKIYDEDGCYDNKFIKTVLFEDRYGQEQGKLYYKMLGNHRSGYKEKRIHEIKGFEEFDPKDDKDDKNDKENDDDDDEDDDPDEDKTFAQKLFRMIDNEIQWEKMGEK